MNLKKLLMNKVVLAFWVVLWGIGLFMIGNLLKGGVNYFFPLNDAFVYYVGGSLFKEGKDLYGINIDFMNVKNSQNLEFNWDLGYVYPPLWAKIISWFTFLTADEFVFWWYGLNILLLTAWIIFIKKYFSFKSMVFLVLLYPPLIGSAIMGQVNILFLWCVTLLLFTDNKWMNSVAWFSWSLIKVYPGLLVVLWIIRKEWGVLWRSGLLVVFSCLLIFIVNESDLWILYFTNLLGKLQFSNSGYFANQSLSSVLFRLFGDSPIQNFIKLVMTFGVIAWLSYWTKIQGKNIKVQLIVWVNALGILAGRMTYWNFLPNILGILYIRENLDKYSREEKLLFWLSVVLGHLIWWFSYPVSRLTVENTLLLFLSEIIVSAGFISILIQTWLLTK